MRLFEYQGKELFSKYSIPVPRSVLVRDEAGVPSALDEVGLPAVLKAQVLAGGRGKAGAVVVVRTEDEARKEGARLLGMKVADEPVRQLLVERAVDHEAEVYLSISLDRGSREFVVIASTSGGTEVEAQAKGGTVKASVPLEGLSERAASEVGEELGMGGRTSSEFRSLLLNLERLSREEECELAEINPVALLHDGRLIALDSKVVLDDNALFRHPEFSRLPPEDPLEGEAADAGFAFVRLEGEVAVVGNGAGLVLSTLDLVADLGGRAACFLDLGGGAQRERVESALRLVGRLTSAKAILVNIFGGITHTVDVAEGIASVLGEKPIAPVFARISGVDEERARSLLAGSRARVFVTARDAALAAVKEG